MAKVYKVEVDADGIRDLCKSQQAHDELQRICDERCAEINADAARHLQAPLKTPLFMSKVVEETNTYMGIIHGVGITHKGGRKQPIAQQIDSKYHVMTW